MHAMVLKKLGSALEWTEIADRQPGQGQIRVKVTACGVCRTDLHVVDGELPDPKLPIIPGHEIVGRIDAIGAGVENLQIGERIGIPWLGHTCGICLEIGIVTRTTSYPLREANQALADLRAGRFEGGAVLVP